MKTLTTLASGLLFALSAHADNGPQTQAPAKVSLYIQTSEGHFVCEAIVVSPRQLRTASHCLTSSKDGSLDGFKQLKVRLPKDTGATSLDIDRSQISLQADGNALLQLRPDQPSLLSP